MSLTCTPHGALHFIPLIDFSPCHLLPSPSPLERPQMPDCPDLGPATIHNFSFTSCIQLLPKPVHLHLEAQIPHPSPAVPPASHLLGSDHHLSFLYLGNILLPNLLAHTFPCSFSSSLVPRCSFLIGTQPHHGLNAAVFLLPRQQVLSHSAPGNPQRFTKAPRVLILQEAWGAGGTRRGS